MSETTCKSYTGTRIFINSDGNLLAGPVGMVCNVMLGLAWLLVLQTREEVVDLQED